MIVYWLKEKNSYQKIGYEKKDLLKEFCDNHLGLDYKWEKAPKSHFTILDISESNFQVIKDFIKNDLKINSYKISSRSNESVAKTLITKYIYLEELKPIYNDPFIDFDNFLEKINSKYNTKFKKDDFNY